MEKIVVIDFAGTLVKAEVIEEANVLRAEVFGKALPSKKEHANPEEFYKINREFVSKLTGLRDDFKIKYRKNDMGFMNLSGVDIQNQISSNLFQIGMYMSAKKNKLDIFPSGLINQLERIKELGYKIAIVSGVRTDIISGVLNIVDCPVEFDYIYGQPPKLGVENQEEDIKELEKIGKIEFALGDKLSDLERTPDSKNIFVKWGHPSGGEEEFADYSISQSDELEGIIQ